ncbi:MAG TPA: hypothetical protein VN880_18550, partial [Solirubrobacteraceae bacterium]|nr:hypothetical protein [Solirubrobacteraceae bacterium]
MKSAIARGPPASFLAGACVVADLRKPSRLCATARPRYGGFGGPLDPPPGGGGWYPLPSHATTAVDG